MEIIIFLVVGDFGIDDYCIGFVPKISLIVTELLKFANCRLKFGLGGTLRHDNYTPINLTLF